jgi:uncharacterized surface protein with fasciclin (FAS1) repeats
MGFYFSKCGNFVKNKTIFGLIRYIPVNQIDKHFMLNPSIRIFSILFCVFSLGLMSCEQDQVEKRPNLAAVLAEDARFSTLVDALQRTDMRDMLNNEERIFTIFAPHNEAFDDLLLSENVANLDELETKLGTDGLAQILRYHMLGSRVEALGFFPGYFSTLADRDGNEAQPLTAYLEVANGIEINDRATVSQADIEASNGVIHAVDEVLLPLDIVELTALGAQHGELLTAVEAAAGGLDTTLVGEGPFTIFAPYDAAFLEAEETLASLSPEELTEVLTYHVVYGNFRSDDLSPGALPTVNGQNLTLSITDDLTIVDNSGSQAEAQLVNVQGTNGVVHFIDGLLLPNR